MKTCPKCGASIDSNAKFCSYCGADQSQYTNESSYNMGNNQSFVGKIPWQVDLPGIIVGFLCLGIIPGVIALLGNSQAKNNQDVKNFVLAYNVFLILAILGWVVILFGLILALGSINHFT